MNDFNNNNYSWSHRQEPVGIYRILKAGHKSSGKSFTNNFFVVRVHDYRRSDVLTTAIGKAPSMEEAEAMFLKHEPDWQGEIPFYDVSQKAYKRKLEKRRKSA